MRSKRIRKIVEKETSMDYRSEKHNIKDYFQRRKFIYLQSNWICVEDIVLQLGLLYETEPSNRSPMKF